MLRRASSSDTMSIRLWSALDSGYFAKKLRQSGAVTSDSRLFAELVARLL